MSGYFIATLLPQRELSVAWKGTFDPEQPVSSRVEQLQQKTPALPRPHNLEDIKHRPYLCRGWRRVTSFHDLLWELGPRPLSSDWIMPWATPEVLLDISLGDRFPDVCLDGFHSRPAHSLQKLLGLMYSAKLCQVVAYQVFVAQRSIPLLSSDNRALLNRCMDKALNNAKVLAFSLVKALRNSPEFAQNLTCGVVAMVATDMEQKWAELLAYDCLIVPKLVDWKWEEGPVVPQKPQKPEQTTTEQMEMRQKTEQQPKQTKTEPMEREQQPEKTTTEQMEMEQTETEQKMEQMEAEQKTEQK
ncbi:hypothetical protein CDD83_483 [Cordyceps sp. RAO-2017]|nr:hypothetical protein CDD83_483 [Cordyceps sp. RAO-2017]